MRDSTQWVHDRTVEGMNSGQDVHSLMRDIRLPAHFDVGEGYGKTSWNVRAIWENYAGWFHHRSTTSLDLPSNSIAPDLVALAGAMPCRRDVSALRLGPTRGALHLTDIVLAADPQNPDARAVAADASRLLLGASTNFWERGWPFAQSPCWRGRDQCSQLRLQRARVLVTGGTSGIGHAIASAFAEAGALVGVTGTREEAGAYEVDLSASPTTRWR